MAARTGVATPSLYKHVRNLAELRPLMIAYRDHVDDHPHRYSALPLDPLSDPKFAASGARQLEVMLAVLRGFG